MDLFLGIDIGSSSTKGVVVDGAGEVQASCIIRTKPRHRDGVEIILDSLLVDLEAALDGPVGREDIRYCVGTGYGRSNVECADKVLTEISCHARGVHRHFPAARTVIDIGGQDSKVIRIDEEGNVLDFVMNEKCAAGTGRFLEAVSKILRVRLEDLGELSRGAAGLCKISSTCIVFAESEIISRLAEGTAPESVARGVHQAMVSRLLSMGKRVGLTEPVVFSGGVAENVGMVDEVIHQLNIPAASLLIPPQPKLTGALGAALFARDTAGHQATM